MLPSANLNVAAQSKVCAAFSWSNSENGGFEYDSGCSTFYFYVFMSC